MAVVPAPPILLGERPERLDDSAYDGRPGGFPLSGRPRRSESSPAGEPPTAPHRGHVPLTSLTTIAAYVERAATETVSLHERDLPVELRAKTPMAVLRRRADKRGKRLLLVCASRELRRVAQAAGVETEFDPTPDAFPIPERESTAERSPVGDVRSAEGSEAIWGTISAARDRLAQKPQAKPAENAAAPAASSARREAIGRLQPTSPPQPRAFAPGAVPDAQQRSVDSTKDATNSTPEVQHVSLDTTSNAQSIWSAARVPMSPALLLHLTGVRTRLQALPLAAAGDAAARRFATTVRSDAATAMLKRLPAGVGQALALGGVFGTVVLLLALAIVPSATVQLTLVTESVVLELPVMVDPGIKKPDVANGKLPGRTISKEIVETAQIPTTGRRPSPDARASGEIVLINRSNKSVTLPKGTVALAGTTKFTTLSDVTVPGTTFSGPQQRFGMGRVGVQAMAGGPAGNVDRFQINKLEGPLAGTLDVQNDAPTRGGSDRTVSYVTAEDQRKLHESLSRTLAERLQQQLKGQLPALDKESAVPWSGQNPAIVEAVFSKNVDEEAQTLSLTMKMRYGVTVFNNASYNAFVEQLGASKAGQLRPGFRAVHGSIEPQPPAVTGIENGAVQLTALAKATLVAHVDSGRVRSDLANRPLASAHAHIGAIPGVAAYELRSWPGWLGRMPWLGWRISVVGSQ
ncbi:MAG: hypothetical protein HY332_19625 [Chloroflexi bacterium]|nr:hypothetical protein [Chloroflexota bacterium]